MNIYEALAKYVLQEVLVDELPRIALEALESGLDSPSLRQLAGAARNNTDENRRLFMAAVKELGFPVPSEAEAGMMEAKLLAGQALDGSITPYSAARQIYHGIYSRFRQLKELRSIAGLADAYEENENEREHYTHEMLLEFKKIAGLRERGEL